MPYLVFDGLGRHALPPPLRLRRIIRAILERNYAAVCPPEYLEKVVASVKPNGYRLRAPRYLKSEQRSEEHTSELQSLMRISYAVFCLKKQKTHARRPAT